GATATSAPRISASLRMPAGLFADDGSLRRLFVEVVEERIRARFQVGQVDRDRLPRLDDALAMQLEALELDRLAITVGDVQLEAGVGGDDDLRRVELAARELELEHRIVGTGMDRR